MNAFDLKNSQKIVIRTELFSSEHIDLATTCQCFLSTLSVVMIQKVLLVTVNVINVASITNRIIN